MMPSLEVLAPAGSFEHLKVAIASGADAIYIGIKGLSARPDEWSFDLEEARDAISLAHENNRRLYFAINASIGEYNFQNITDLLNQIGDTHCDALILGNWGVIRLVADMNLGIPLHASTLLGVYNVPTINLLAEMGVTRVVLNTNLMIHEIAEMTRGVSTMEYEIIAYGGLCYNDNWRCRLPHYTQNGVYHVGCKDSYQYEDEQGEIKRFTIGFADIDLSPSLSQYIAIGITSFKIEGRTRSAEYISRSTSVMRKAVDEYIAFRKKNTIRYYS